MGTGMIRWRGSRSSSAMMQMMSRQQSVSRPPMSKTPPVVSGVSRTPARYVSTFSTAIGWQGVLTHLGVIVSGKR